ncbi:LysR family transcriptional regulator [Shewanella youngdeokensis]|uniref:LysR family transcriptional regulator n=1 Tax=Shewanella youngdeokensis TaxID=2999068 RepID=A0ABZ0JYG8_9GAMM|nr:LysR family transcriptional regulator [Shewanella sp. DAU334]
MRPLDFNLLRVLEVLLEEQSVTAAAARLNLSQSAVSKQLSKLRETFDDALFERTASGLKATPRALQLAPELREVLRQLDQFTRPSTFNPADSRRRFRMHLVETAYSLTFPHFMPQMLKLAPKVRFNSQTWSHDSMDQLLRCQIDLAITCREWDKRSLLHMDYLPEELAYAEITRDKSVCLVRRGHPLLDEPWNLDTFLKYRHLQVAFGGLEHWLLDDVLALDQLYRDIAVNMTDFTGALKTCENSDLILCAPEKYITHMMPGNELVCLDVPVDVEPGAYVLVWHKHFNLDPSHKWLRDLIIDGVNKAQPNW